MHLKSFHTIAFRKLFLAPVVFFIVASNCNHSTSTSGPLPPGILHNLDNGNAGQTVAVALGDTVDITLQTIGPGDYGTPEISSPAILFEKMLPVSAQVINPGGPIQIYQFIACMQGEATIFIPHTFQNIVFTVTLDVGTGRIYLQ